MKLRFEFVISAVFLLSMALAACDKKSSSAGKKGPLPQKSVYGSVLNVSIDATIDTLDAQKSVYASAFEIIGDITDGLMQMADDGSVKKAVCEEEIVSADGKLYTFKLRHDCYWSNGDPVTAHDFVYGWQRAVDPATESEYAFMMSDIAQVKNAVAIQAGLMEPNQLGVRAVDDYTFEVQLQVPVSYFDQLLYFCTFYPANQAFVESCGDSYASSPDTILSNGAFLVTDYSPKGKSIDLIKNTAYYDADKVKLGGIHYEMISNTSEGLNLYKQGKLDLFELAGDQVPEFLTSKEFRAVDSGFLYYIVPNLHVKELANKNLRMAMTFAIDREAAAKILGDGSKGAYQCVPSGYAFNSSGEDFNRGVKEFENVCAYDPQKAREYYKKAQAELGKSSFKFEFLCADNPEQIAVINDLISRMESILPGMHFTLKLVPKSERRKLMGRHDFEIGLTNWGPDYADPMTYLSMWMTGNDNNNGDYSNPQYDAIIADCQEGSLCTKPAERWSALKEAQSMVMNSAIVYPLFQQCNADLIKSTVKNISFHPVAINRIYKNTTKQ